MIFEGSSFNFYQDFQTVAYFTIVLECFDIAFYFMMQKARNKDRSPRWILVFSAFFTSAGAMQIIRALISAIYGNDPGMIPLMNRINFLIANVTSVIIIYLIQDFFKQGSQKTKRFLKACIIIAVACSIVNVLNLFLSEYLERISLAGTLVAFTFDLLFPVYLVFQLLKRSDESTKKSFFFIFIGMVLTMAATLLNAQALQERFEAILAPDVFTLFNSFNLLVFIISLGIIIVNFFFIPPVEDFFWIDDILGVYIYDKNQNTLIYKASFEEDSSKPQDTLENEEVSRDDHDKILVGGLVGIGTLLKEITSSKGKELEFIDKGAVKLFISHDENLLFVLVSRHSLPLFKLKLYNFKQEFLIYYADLVAEWVETPEKFQSVDKLVSLQFLKTPARENIQEGTN